MDAQEKFLTEQADNMIMKHFDELVQDYAVTPIWVGQID